MKKRRNIPARIANRLLYDTDRTCCLCRKPGRSLEFHHIDSDSSNNDAKNLAVFCHDHHDEASKQSGLGRALNSEQIRMYMDGWLRYVKSRRAVYKNTATNRVTHELILEALAVHEIRKIRIGLMDSESSEKVRYLRLLDTYTDFRYGYEVRTELLEVLARLAERIRVDMTAEVAQGIVGIASSALPIFSLVRPTRRRPKKAELTLLRQGVELGAAITYDAVRHQRDIRVVFAATNIMWDVLRFAQLNNLQELKKGILAEFTRIEKAAKLAGFRDAGRWLEFERKDALALEGQQRPAPPDDIVDKLFQLGRPSTIQRRKKPNK